jgi:hypothetical protein
MRVAELLGTEDLSRGPSTLDGYRDERKRVDMSIRQVKHVYGVGRIVESFLALS